MPQEGQLGSSGLQKSSLPQEVGTIPWVTKIIASSPTLQMMIAQVSALLCIGDKWLSSCSKFKGTQISKEILRMF